jgi:hypothetical protein
MEKLAKMGQMAMYLGLSYVGFTLATSALRSSYLFILGGEREGPL